VPAALGRALGSLEGAARWPSSPLRPVKPSSFLKPFFVAGGHLARTSKLVGITRTVVATTTNPLQLLFHKLSCFWLSETVVFLYSYRNRKAKYVVEQTTSRMTSLLVSTYPWAGKHMLCVGSKQGHPHPLAGFHFSRWKTEIAGCPHCCGHPADFLCDHPLSPKRFRSCIAGANSACWF